MHVPSVPPRAFARRRVVRRGRPQRRRAWTALGLATALVGTAATPARALAPTPYQAQGTSVGGARMRCVAHDGRPVLVRFAPDLGDVGMATWTPDGRPLILINPRAIARYSDRVAQWWFAHECGHHALAPGQNGERAADCYGIRAMVGAGAIREVRQLDVFARELGGLPGTAAGHPPGPLRARLIAACADLPGSGRGMQLAARR